MMKMEIMTVLAGMESGVGRQEAEWGEGASGWGGHVATEVQVGNSPQ